MPKNKQEYTPVTPKLMMPLQAAREKVYSQLSKGTIIAEMPMTNIEEYNEARKNMKAGAITQLTSYNIRFLTDPRLHQDLSPNALNFLA